jgi:plasmid maintenance system antidote protein VapI
MAKDKEEITQAEILEIVVEMSKKWERQKDLADHLGISNAYMSDILAGVRPVSDRVARKLGYKRIVKYTREGGIEQKGKVKND